MEEVDLSGQNSVDAEWMAYIGAFRYLRSLNVSDCHKLTNSALWTITGIPMSESVGFIVNFYSLILGFFSQ